MASFIFTLLAIAAALAAGVAAGHLAGVAARAVVVVDEQRLGHWFASFFRPASVT